MRCWWSKSLHPASTDTSQPASQSASQSASQRRCLSVAALECRQYFISFHFISFHFFHFISFISANRQSIFVCYRYQYSFPLRIHHPSSIIHPAPQGHALAAPAEPGSRHRATHTPRAPHKRRKAGQLLWQRRSLERDMSLFHFSALEPSPAFGQPCQRPSSM